MVLQLGLEVRVCDRAAVTAGFSWNSGGSAPSGDLSDEGDMRFTELARRGGAAPLAECSELREALRRSVGVADRESRPLVLAGPFRGLRGAPRLLATLGDRLRDALKAEEVDGREECDDDLAGEAIERSFSERESSEAASRSLLAVFVDSRRRGDDGVEKVAITGGAAIQSRSSKQAAAVPRLRPFQTAALGWDESTALEARSPR